MLSLLLIPLLASTALAHFTLDFPTSRGFDEDKEPDFCGGYTAVTPRQPFPLTAGPVRIDSHHSQAVVSAFLSTGEKPTSFADFNTTSNGTSIPLVTNFFLVRNGEYCFNTNLANLGIGLTNGSLVTLQVQYNGGDGNLYQCTDLILLSDYTVPANQTCTNDAAVAGSGGATASSTATAEDGASASGSGATTTSAAATGGGAATSASATSSASGAGARSGIISCGVVGALAGVIGLSVL